MSFRKCGAVLALLAAVAATRGEPSQPTLTINQNTDPKAAADQILSAIKASQKETAEDNGDGAAPEETANAVASDVVVLTDANFAGTVTADAKWMVEFYAPWCGHCKSLAPEYEAAATQMAAELPGAKLGKVDATVETTIASAHDVQGYPTLKVFPTGADGKAFAYEGGRTAVDIVQHMKKVVDGSWKPPVDRVVALTTESFDDFVAAEEITMVEFYAPWCGHCKKLAPEYEKAAAQLWPKIKIAKVDATEHKELGERFEVTGYPTIKVFLKGEASEYDGSRDASGIVTELTELSSDVAKELTTIFDSTALVDSDEHAIIGFFESTADAGYAVYQAAAKEHRKKFKFHYSVTPKVLGALRAKPGTVTVYRPKFYTSKYDAPSATATVGESAAELAAFLLDNAYPLVGERRAGGGGEVPGAHAYPQRPLVVVFADFQTDPDFRAESKVLHDQVAEVAEAFRDQPVTFAVTGADAELKDLGLADQDADLKVAIFWDEKTKYSKLDEDSTIESFVQDAIDGKLEKWIKSEPVPKKNKGPVQVVVGKSFDSIVNDESKDVLIEFYAPWCGHCKSLEPKYKKLAKKLKDVEDLVIAKMDATANDVPSEYDVTGFPTIYFVAKAGKAAPQLYEGERDVKGFLKFLRANSSAKLPAAKKKAKKTKAAKDEL